MSTTEEDVVDFLNEHFPISWDSACLDALVALLQKARAEGRAEERAEILAKLATRIDEEAGILKRILRGIAEWIKAREEPTDGR